MDEMIKKIVRGELKLNDALNIIKNSQEQIILVNENQMIMLNMKDFKSEVSQKSVWTLISAFKKLVLKNELDVFEQKVMFYIMQCVTLTLFNLRNTLFGPRLLKLTLISILKSNLFNVKNIIMFSEELHKIRRKTEYYLTDCKLYKLKYLLKFIESFRLYNLMEQLPDLDTMLAGNVQDKNESQLCEVYFYGFILRLRYDEKAFKLFEHCFKILTGSQKFKEDYNTFLYYLKNISKQMFITDCRSFTGIIKDIMTLDIVRENNDYSELIESFLNYLFYECIELGIIESDILRERFTNKVFDHLVKYNNKINDKVKLEPNEIYLTIKAKKFLLSKYLRFKNIVSAEQQFYNLFFTLEIIQKYTTVQRNSELNRLIVLAYFYLYKSHKDIPEIGINIFKISKQFFTNYQDYKKFLMPFNDSKKCDLVEFVYTCESEDELQNYLDNFPKLDEIKIFRKVITTILESTLQNSRRSDDLFLKLSALSWWSLHLWPYYSDPYLTINYRLKDKNAIKLEFQRTFKSFLLFIGFEQESISTDNLEQFFESLENSLKLYSLSRSKIMKKYLFLHEIPHLLVHLPRFIFSDNFALCENYLASLKSFLCYCDFNMAISKEKRVVIDQISGLYYYCHKNYQQCIHTFDLYEYELEQKYYINLLFQSYKNLNKFEQAEQLLQKYIDEFMLKVFTIEKDKEYNLQFDLAELHLLLVDLFIKMNENEKALGILEFITSWPKLNRFNSINGNFKKGFQKFKIEKYYRGYYSTLVMLFNTTSLDTSILEHYLQNEELMQNDESFIIKSSKFDQEQLKSFEKLEKLKYFNNLVIILFTYSENGQVILTRTNKNGKEVKSPGEIINCYFHNNVFKGFQYLNKFFFFNLIETEGNQSKEPNIQSLNEADNHLSNELDKLDINFIPIEYKSLNKPEQNVHLNNIFLWQKLYHNINDITIPKFIKILGRHIFNKFIDLGSTSFSTNEQDNNEIIQYIGWVGDNFDIFEEKIDQDNTNNLETSEKDRLCIILSSSDLFCYLNANPREWRLGDKYDQMGLIMAFIKLNYQVELVKDKTSVEIKDYFELLENDNRLEKFSSITLIILTHGCKDGYVFGADCRPVSIENDILIKLNRSKYLKNKEKVIIVNACRGDKRDFNRSKSKTEELNTDLIDYYYDQFNDELNMQDSNDQDRNAELQSYNEHELFSNMLVCYSTHNGYVSFRDPETGSWFITAFLASLLSKAKTYNLVDLLIYVEKILINEFPLRKIKKDQMLPKQSTEIILYNWNKDYFI